MHQIQPYLVSHSIPKTNKPFTIGEELILPPCTDFCREVFGESAVKKDSTGSFFGSHCCQTLKFNYYSGLLRHHSLQFSVMSQPILKTKLCY